MDVKFRRGMVDCGIFMLPLALKRNHLTAATHGSGYGPDFEAAEECSARCPGTDGLKIAGLDVILIGPPPEFTQGVEGEFLVTPLHMFPDYEKMLGSRFVGLRGGPAYAVLVRITTDEGLYGIGSVGVRKRRARLMSSSTISSRLCWARIRSMSSCCGKKCSAARSTMAERVGAGSHQRGRYRALGHYWQGDRPAGLQPAWRADAGADSRLRQPACTRTKIWAGWPAQADAFRQQGFTAMKQRFGYGPRDGLAGHAPKPGAGARRYAMRWARTSS